MLIHYFKTFRAQKNIETETIVLHKLYYQLVSKDYQRQTPEVVFKRLQEIVRPLNRIIPKHLNTWLSFNNKAKVDMLAFVPNKKWYYRLLGGTTLVRVKHNQKQQKATLKNVIQLYYRIIRELHIYLHFHSKKLLFKKTIQRAKRDSKYYDLIDDLYSILSFNHQITNTDAYLLKHYHIFLNHSYQFVDIRNKHILNSADLHRLIALVISSIKETKAHQTVNTYMKGIEYRNE